MVAKKDNNDENFSDNFYQINHYIHEIHDLTTRVDERVKTVFKQLNETDKKIEKLRDNYSSLVTKINTIELHELPCLNKKIIELKNEFEILSSEFKECIDKVQKYEFDTKDLKSFKRSTEDRFKFFLDTAFKTLMTIGCAYVVYKLGWTK